MKTYFKSHSGLWLAAALSIVFSAAVWQYTMLTDVPRLDLSRGEIAARAEVYAAARGFSGDGFLKTITSRDVFLNPGSPSLAYLSERFTTPQLRDLLGSEQFYLSRWVVFWNLDVPLNVPQESVAIMLGNTGEVVSFTHDLGDSVLLGDAPVDSAKRIATAFLRDEHRIDAATLGFKSMQSDKAPNGTKHTFTWRRKLESLPDTTEQVEVVVFGSRITGYARKFIAPPGYDLKATSGAAGETALRFVPSLLNFLFTIILGAIFLRKYHEGEVGVKSGLILFFAVLSLGALSWLNIISSVAAGSSFGLNRTGNAVMLFAFGLINYIFVAGIVFFTWTIGESDARRFGTHARLAAIDALLHRQWFSKEVGQAILSGIALGAVTLAATLVWTLICRTFFGAWHSRNGIGFMAARAVLPLSSYLELYSILATAISLRLFLMERLARWVKSQVAASLLVALIWVLYADTHFLMYPFWQSVVGGVLIGAGLNLAYFRFGLLTTAVAELGCYIAFSAVPLLAAKGWFYPAIGATDAGILLALFGFGAAALARGKKFEFKGSALPGHIERISQRVRMEEELKIAKDVQLSLLPQRDPKVRGLDISGICIPALEVGGDYYDYLPLGEGKFGVAIGDVSGKGVPAAIYMTLAKGVVQSHADVLNTPKEVLVRINSLLCKTMKRGTFISMIYAIIDLDTKRLTYARAGHNPLMVVGRETKAMSAPMPKGMALGLSDGKVFALSLEENAVDLRSGDTLVLYTDGFSEAMNEAGEEYGEARLLSSLQQHENKATSAEIIKAICKDVQRFTGLSPQHDDMTMVVMKVK